MDKAQLQTTHQPRPSREHKQDQVEPCHNPVPPQAHCGRGPQSAFRNVQSGVVSTCGNSMGQGRFQKPEWRDQWVVDGLMLWTVTKTQAVADESRSK